MLAAFFVDVTFFLAYSFLGYTRIQKSGSHGCRSFFHFLSNLAPASVLSHGKLKPLWARPVARGGVREAPRLFPRSLYLWLIARVNSVG